MEGRLQACHQRMAAEPAAVPPEAQAEAQAAGILPAAEHSPAEARCSHFLPDCPAFCREAEACQPQSQ